MRNGILLLLLAISIKSSAQTSTGQCSCAADSAYVLRFHSDVAFRDYPPFNIDTLSRWNNESRLRIKSIALVGFDTIPKELSLFENVERVHLLGVMKHINLDIFRHLKILILEEAQINLDSSVMLENLEVIITNKTKISGIKSFKTLPKIKEIMLSYSGFDAFPSDFESMQCLSYFTSGAHTFGNIDLSKIDLSKMPCLKSVEFHSWRDNISGLPKGLSRKKKIKIHYDKMKAADKTKLKQYGSQ